MGQKTLAAYVGLCNMSMHGRVAMSRSPIIDPKIDIADQFWLRAVGYHSVDMV